MSKYGIILLFICTLDLSFTSIGIYLGYFTELNPLLNWFIIGWGLPGLIFAKSIFTIIPIFILETAPKYCDTAHGRIGHYYKFVIYSYIFVLSSSILFQLDL